MKQYLVSWMCCLVNCLFYCTRLNPNIAIIEMTRMYNIPEGRVGNMTQFTSNINNNTSHSQAHSSIPSFDWDEITQQRILGAFYYGYAVIPIPGGWLAGKIGGKRIIGFAVILTSLLSALIPWAAGVGVGLVMTLRILDGLGQGIALAAIYVILRKWTDPSHRSTMVSISFSGWSIGTIISSYVSGWICSSYEFGGWPMSFYIYGIFGVIVFIMWIVLVYETPEEDSCISQKQLEYLNRSVIRDQVTAKNTSVPWRGILTALPVWALVFGLIAFDFGLFLIVIETPTFISTILGFNVKTTGMLASIPSIVRFPVVLLAAVCADYIIGHEYLSVRNTRKLFIIINLGGSATFFIALAYAGHSSAVTSMVLLTMAFVALGFNNSSISVNPLDISPKYSGIIVGVMFTFGSCSGFAVPAIVGLVLEDNNTFEQWSKLFLLTAGVELFGMLFFLIFAEGEEQKWSKNDKISKEEKEHLLTEHSMSPRQL